jgi:hypothetical protein
MFCEQYNQEYEQDSQASAKVTYSRGKAKVTYSWGKAKVT